jgi:lipopolysaccharide export system permease protein
MTVRLLKPLDRYVFGEFWKIFVVTALGFPIITDIIDLTDHLGTYLNRNLSPRMIALSYLYWTPGNMFLVIPAAVLFATVFSVTAFSRHSEITAAKASGMSFYRFILPIVVGALMAVGLDVGISELMPVTNALRNNIIEEDKSRGLTLRNNFAFAAELGRVYKVGLLNTVAGTMQSLQIERRGRDITYPTYIVSAQKATYRGGKWELEQGQMNIVSDSTPGFAFDFARMIDNEAREPPAVMMAKPHSADEMGYQELSRFIRAMERSGTDVNEPKVELALKIAIPVTCIIIALFGAPLATSNQRGGAAYGIAISLATTVIFLMAVQVTKAVGGAAIVAPDLAAWIPNAAFALVGLVLLVRVRT